jgi:hypothetical protein
MIKNHTISLESTVSQVKGNIISDMGGEKVMLSISKGKYYNLGEIGGEVWEKIENKTQVKQLITSLMTIYNVEGSVCEEQVISFLELLLKEELIEVV